MWPTRSTKIQELDQALQNFSNNHVKLAGIAEQADREALVMQMIASLRRLDYTTAIRSRHISTNRTDPTSDLFDPERAAALLARTGQVDEAIWLIFLATHFGQHGRHKWRMLRDVYSGLGVGTWTWARVSADPQQFRTWLQQNVQNIRGAFGNHRKYETLNPASNNGTATVIESFVQCFAPSPSRWFAATLVRSVGNDPHVLFDKSYNRLTIARFGRLAKFDFLALLGRLDLAPISPGSAYLTGATGPLRGARLLIDGKASSTTRAVDLDEILRQLRPAPQCRNAGHGRLNLQLAEEPASVCSFPRLAKRARDLLPIESPFEEVHLVRIDNVTMLHLTDHNTRGNSNRNSIADDPVAFGRQVHEFIASAGRNENISGKGICFRF